MANKLLGVFFKGFEDCKKRVKKLFPDINTILVSSIAILEETIIVAVEDIVKGDVDVQVIDASASDPLLTSSKAVSIAEVLEVPAEVQPEAQVAEV